MPLQGNPADWRAGSRISEIYKALVSVDNGSHRAGKCPVCDPVYRSLRDRLGSKPFIYRSGGSEMPPGVERGRRLRNEVFEIHEHMVGQSWLRDADGDIGCGGCDNGECCGACECCPQDAPEPAPEPAPAPSEARRCHAVSDYVAALVAANVPVWLHGPAGTGKSSAARYAADKAGLDYYEVNLAGAMASAIKGKDRLKEFVASEFARAYEFGGLICLEEFDAAHPTVATAINNAIAGDHFSNDADGRTIARHPDFRIVATANTLGTGATKEFNGRMKLDGATLDRFRMGRVYVGLDAELEAGIFASLRTSAAHDRFYREVKRLRAFVDSREGFDALTSMRVVIDGCKAITAGVPVEGLLASIGATWQAETRAQAQVPTFDYAGWRP
jgi:hypothetical protein